jgi:hypothetical protein
LTFSCWISGQISTKGKVHRLQIADLVDNCRLLKRNFEARLDSLERRQCKLSRLYLNTSIGDHMNPWWQKWNRGVYGDANFVTKTW